MKKILIVITTIILSTHVFAKKEDSKQLQKASGEAEINASIVDKKNRIKDIDDKIAKNIWLKHYNDFQLYKKLIEEQDSLKNKLYHLRKTDNEEEAALTQKKLEAIKKQITIYGESKGSVFGDLTKVDEVVSPKNIDNPLLIFSAVSAIRGLDDKKNVYENRLEEIDKLIEQLKTKKALLQSIDANITKVKNSETSQEKEARINELELLNKQIVEIKNERDDFDTTVSIFVQKSSEVSQRLKFEIKEQLLKLLNIAIIIIGLFILSIFIKFVTKKYLKEDHEKSYIANKFIGITTYLLITLTLLLSYIENVSYLVTILGFASAGIAIAMKDWFMSILGWFTIISSGMIRVGDRIRVNSSDSGDVLADVLDISPLKITVYEDVTMLSYDRHKRAGRVVFIPNNLIFSKMIFNYSHQGLQTVWDSITFALTYDSDIDKAMTIIRDIVQKHTKGYTRHTEKETRKLRATLSIRNYAFEPRVLTFIEPYGIAISTWFLTDSYRALSMKSVISKDIFDSIRHEPDIRLAYPTSMITFDDVEQKAKRERLNNE